MATEPVRAHALVRVGGFQAFVVIDDLVTLTGPNVVSLSSARPPDDLLQRATEAAEAGHRLELERAAIHSELASVAHDEFIELARFTSTRGYLIELLTAHRGSVTDAARAAGLVRESLHRLIRRHGLDAEQFRQRGNEGPTSGA